MKKLLIKIAVSGFLILITYGILWSIPSNPQFVYASVIDKHQRLESLKSPKMIFVGGSGIALGLDSQRIEEKFNLPVVNMGVNGGFGLRYMLEEVKPFIGPGDIIIVVPEYDYFFGSALNGGQNLLWVLCVYPSAIRYIKPQQYLHLLLELPLFMQVRFLEILSPKVDPIYNRSAFNQRGDFVGHLSLPPTTINLYSLGQANTFNQDAVTAINDFQNHVNDRNAKLILFFPAIPKEFLLFEDNQQRVQQVYSQLHNNTSVTILSTPENYTFSDHYFFDTVYHLNDEGRHLRTENMARELEQTIIQNLTQK